MSGLVNGHAAPEKFLRTELKVLVDAAQAAGIAAWADANLVRDVHAGVDGAYRIHTLYLDTQRLDIYNRAGDSDGTKYRIRRYGSEDLVWLECKRRRCSSVSKRRVPWPLDRLQEFLDGRGRPEGWAETFQDTIRLRNYLPRLLVTYPRRAWKEGAHARLTLDWKIAARIPRGRELFGMEGTAVPVSQDLVVELKFDDVCPSGFQELLRRLGRDPASFSKYGRGVEAVGLALSGSPDRPRIPRAAGGPPADPTRHGGGG
jgi:hypothetical protein